MRLISKTALILGFLSLPLTGCLSAKKKASFCDVVKVEKVNKGQCFFSAKALKPSKIH